MKYAFPVDKELCAVTFLETVLARVPVATPLKIT